MNKILLIALVVSVCGVSFAYAGDSLTIGVSCTIPAIPGVNVPLAAVQTQVQVKEEAVQEEKLIVVTQLDRTDDSKTVETIYSR